MFKTQNLEQQLSQKELKLRNEQQEVRRLQTGTSVCNHQRFAKVPHWNISYSNYSLEYTITTSPG